MATLRLPIRVSLAADALDELDIAVDGAIRDAFDIAEVIMREEGEAARIAIGVESFGAETGPPGVLPLQIRSGDAIRSIDTTTKRLAPFHIVTTVGALNAPPDVERYLTVQEEGAVIRPRYAEKLAFPPGDAGWPARNDAGVQVLTAHDFLEAAESFGYDFVLFTDDAILARQVGMADFELIFIRRDEVTIPARHPIGSQEEPTVRRIDRRVQQALA